MFWGVLQCQHQFLLSSCNIHSLKSVLWLMVSSKSYIHDNFVRCIKHFRFCSVFLSCSDGTYYCYLKRAQGSVGHMRYDVVNNVMINFLQRIVYQYITGGGRLCESMRDCVQRCEHWVVKKRSGENRSDILWWRSYEMRVVSPGQHRELKEKFVFIVIVLCPDPMDITLFLYLLSLYSHGSRDKHLLGLNTTL